MDLSRLDEQREVLKKSLPPLSISPLREIANSGNSEDIEAGKKLIREGALGTIILAGGQGTRLGFPHPKGKYPIGNKTLFQIFVERTPSEVPLAIMTSHDNHDETVQYFRENQNFGHPDISFFSQGSLPLLDKKGELTGREGPDGNGQVFHHFTKQGVWKKWQELNIRYVNSVLIDNPIADPADPNLAGFHSRTEASVTIKAVERLSSQEKVGVLVSDPVRVIEYTELPIGADFSLYKYANISLFCLSMDFIKTLSERPFPLHAALKKYPFSDEEVWKFETFIFDMLPWSPKTSVLLYPREKTFQPLKSRSDLPLVIKACRDHQLIDKL